ncbi:beta-N-acetylhexosaminidase [Actinoplanes sp. OR16]|uniref:beta-N-acetylhexosaminidase n=1 Tax=Actinoplanes sp. OR16 TaxID=946334 RepID=UPI000F6C33FD|nr:beta-N-acetylhexosaminidase [Actinoplanes sp. OR16]BBH65167.1 beta-N-acetylhexosaminidase [Actinoplanes sp. OR16]
MRLATLAATSLLVLPLAACTEPAPTPAPLARSLASVLPAPARVTPSGVRFELTEASGIAAEGDALPVAELLAATLRPATGFRLPVAATGDVALRLDTSIAGEAYRLDVGEDRVDLTAGTPAGLNNGVQTLRQLLPAAIDAGTVQQAAWIIPGGRIDDEPRYAYRGAMLDLARHFHTPDEVKRYIDQISRFKINYLHLHLADDQGWRIQIDSWPELTAVSGAPGTGVDGAGGGYLTKAAYRDLVTYAADRYITVIPEVDMPGHVNAAQVAYPELTCDGVAPRQRTDTAVGYSSLCAGKEITYRFAEDVIRELAAMTPGPYLHIGGDEARATPHADYVTFQKRVMPLARKYGKIPIGWQEIAAAEPEGAIVQYWNHTEPLTTNQRVIVSPASQAYLDMQYDRQTPAGGMNWAGTTEVDDAYDWNPGARLKTVPPELIFGVEAPLWSETLRDSADIEFLAFPRLVAIAELGWSPWSTHDWESFRQRIGAYGPQWTRLGVRFYESPKIPWGH